MPTISLVVEYDSRNIVHHLSLFQIPSDDQYPFPSLLRPSYLRLANYYLSAAIGQVWETYKLPVYDPDGTPPKCILPA
jgi:hypothetical protein